MWMTKSAVMSVPFHLFIPAQIDPVSLLVVAAEDKGSAADGIGILRRKGHGRHVVSVEGHGGTRYPGLVEVKPRHPVPAAGQHILIELRHRGAGAGKGIVVQPRGKAPVQAVVARQPHTVKAGIRETASRFTDACCLKGCTYHPFWADARIGFRELSQETRERESLLRKPGSSRAEKEPAVP